MWKSENIKTAMTGGQSQLQLLKTYVEEKNLNVIIARGKCVNRCPKEMGEGELDILLDELAACDSTMVNWTGPKPSPPFMGVAITPETRTARVVFLMDLTREAEESSASPFYSKLMGALSTQFFAAQPDVDRLWFPFTLQDTLGRGVGLESSGQGMFIVRN